MAKPSMDLSVSDGKLLGRGDTALPESLHPLPTVRSISLPDHIRELPLDRDFTPENTHQVVDADSSQMRAAAVLLKARTL
jgi:hypothetical protein